MKVCIHRGTHEVGGTCIEIESQGKRIVLDVGLPLEATDSIESLPQVEGFQEWHEGLLAVVISHPHLDHYGLARYLLPCTQMIMGAATERILKAAMLFTPVGVEFKNVLHLESGKPLSIGPFTITPYLNDHSAYDAYSLLISADGQRLFYSGDFRGHGRKAALFERFLKRPPPDVDVLLMEGTTIGRSGSAAPFQTEQELEQDFLDHIRMAKGMVLVWASGQYVDYEFIELKVDSNNPVSAAMEIMVYGMLYVLSRDHREKMQYARDLNPLLWARNIYLRVLAPHKFYNEYKLAGFEKILNKALGDFLEGRGFGMNFEFQEFPQDFHPRLVLKKTSS